MDFCPLGTRVEISLTCFKRQACLSGGKKGINQMTSIKLHQKDRFWRISEDNCQKQTTDLACKYKIMNWISIGFFAGKESSYTYRKILKKQQCYSTSLNTWKSLSENNLCSLRTSKFYLKRTICPYLSPWKTWTNCLGPGQNDLWRQHSSDRERGTSVTLPTRLTSSYVP